MPAALQRTARPAAQMQARAQHALITRRTREAVALWAPALPAATAAFIATPQVTPLLRPQARLDRSPCVRRLAPARRRPRTLRRSARTPQLQRSGRPGVCVLIFPPPLPVESLVPITPFAAARARRSYDAAGGARHPSSPARGSVSRSSAARGARGSCAVLRRRSARLHRPAVWRPSAPRLGTTPTALARGPRAPLTTWRATIVPPRRGRSRCVRRCGAQGCCPAALRFGAAV